MYCGVGAVRFGGVVCVMVWCGGGGVVVWWCGGVVVRCGAVAHCSAVVACCFARFKLTLGSQHLGFVSKSSSLASMN